MLEYNGQHSLTWLPGYDDLPAEVTYHAWGTPRIGHKEVGESDFLEDGPELAVTEFLIPLLGGMVPVTLSRLTEQQREKLNTFVLDSVGEQVLADKLFEQEER